MQKLNTLRIAASLAVTTAFFYLLIALWFAVSPETGYGFFQVILHGTGATAQGAFDLLQVGFADFILGLVACTALSFFVGLVFPAIYNRSARQQRKETYQSAPLSRPVQL